jgi:hypothetical protein
VKRVHFLLALLAVVALLPGRDLIVRRDGSPLRSGPGSYYPVLMELPSQSRVALIDSLFQWYKIRYQSDLGYLSQTATLALQRRNDVFSGMQSSGSTSVNRHSITAGVRGFADQFNEELRGDSLFVIKVLSDNPDPQPFHEMILAHDREMNLQRYRAQYPLAPREFQDYFLEAQEGFGLALASVIAQQGLYQEPEINQYINEVGNLVALCSDMPDQRFRFYILDIDAANAYSCPGGFVFISRGMLDFLQNEAELAFVLAHEIAHVTRFHGITEIQKRQNQIASSSAFDELDAALGERLSPATRDLTASLEAEVFEIYNTLISGRLDAYEEEADRLALSFMARAAYDYRVSSGLLNRLLSSRIESNNQHYRKESLRQRLLFLRENLRRLEPMNLPLYSFPDKFTARMNSRGNSDQ